MVLISGLIASSYRRSYVTRRGTGLSGDTGTGGRRTAYQGNQYFPVVRVSDGAERDLRGRDTPSSASRAQALPGNSGLPSYGSAFTRNGRQGTYFMNRLFDFWW